MKICLIHLIQIHVTIGRIIFLTLKISKTCPQDGRKFSSILKFVRREGNVMFLHENGAKISCGRPDMPQSHQRPQRPLRPQGPNNLDIPQYVPNSRNLDEFSPEPIWRWRRHKYEPPTGRWIQEQRLKYSRSTLNPRSPRKIGEDFFENTSMPFNYHQTRPNNPEMGVQNPQWCKRNDWIKFGWIWFGGICFCERCSSSLQRLPSSDLEMIERRSTSYQVPSTEEEIFGVKNFRKFRFRRRANHEFMQVLPLPQTSRISQNSRIQRNQDRPIPSEVD
ncbi:hypothetical protein Anas_13779 [Armadillidium nasatum]|uniref:Uncharacterized protein n=1 Tax=Armadillidium nasatum TaxID=96803 RepID=A0A5N5T8M3_9CRUS|nr:hypothetical protein Anas_13779 [Armadillidium nasatum]